MWPKWLADTLDRSALEPRPHRVAEKTQRVRDLDDRGLPSLDDIDWDFDWDDVTGFDIHAGYRGESRDA